MRKLHHLGLVLAAMMMAPTSPAYAGGFREYAAECKRADQFTKGAVLAMQASDNPEDTVIRLMTAAEEFGLSYQAYLRAAILVVYDNRELVKANPASVSAQLAPIVASACLAAVKGMI